eukprot:TRINITY_DN21103_c0_g1_i3.p2 TRINITY_DN21103_c0_g1~~TRINITY_DN21103_c0_g1_i3.p2  ORF type:complete len:145 (+),score=34.71 TRINITY_DN21103_c0_g1_i3:48-482(+)
MAEIEETVAAPAVEESPIDGAPKEMNLLDALREVLKRSLIADGLARGLHECAKALDARRAHLCVLAGNCDQAQYVALIDALCKEHGINLIKVDDKLTLGEWAGLCRIDDQGEAQKVVACSCVVVTDFGEESEALNVLLNHFKSS